MRYILKLAQYILLFLVGGTIVGGILVTGFAAIGYLWPATNIPPTPAIYIITVPAMQTKPVGLLGSAIDAEHVVATQDEVPTQSPTFDASPTATISSTLNATELTLTSQSSTTNTPTITATSTSSNTPSPSSTIYITSTNLFTGSNTPSKTPSPTLTHTPKPTNTKTSTHTSTPIPPTKTQTHTVTPTDVPPTFTATIYSPTSSEPPPQPTQTLTNLPPSPTATQGVASCNYSNHGSWENQLYDIINDFRAENGVHHLVMHSKLRGAAREHSMDMACNDFVSHIGSDGSTNYQRILKYGYTPSRWGENIYMGWNTTPEQAFNWWINSTPHLNNILSPYYTQIGVGHAQFGNSSAFTLVFGTP